MGDMSERAERVATLAAFGSSITNRAMRELDTLFRDWQLRIGVGYEITSRIAPDMDAIEVVATDRDGDETVVRLDMIDLSGNPESMENTLREAFSELVEQLDL